MNDHETNSRQLAAEPSMLKTILWIGVGILVYLGIQWMLPKVGVSS